MICLIDRTHPGGTANHSVWVTARRLPSKSSSSAPSNASSIRYSSCSIAARPIRSPRLPCARLLAPGSSLLHIHPAVDVDLRPRNVLSLGDKKAADPRDFLGPPEAPQRDLGEQRLLHILR